MTKLEYLMVYTQAGLPIYSKCFGTFCKSAFENPEMLAGLLSAIETIPPTLSEGLSLNAVSMGQTTMRFSKIMPSGHSVVIGLSEDRPEVVESVYNAVGKILESDRFRNVDWNVISSELVTDFTSALINDYLAEAMHDYGGFKDECPLGDMCPMHTDPVLSRRQRIWGAIRSRYEDMKRRMAQQ